MPANSKPSSPKGPTSNDDIMAAIKTLKLEMSTTNKALSDSLTLKFNELKSEFQKVSREVSELKTSYASLHSEVEELKGKSPSPDTSVRIEQDKLTISESLGSLENAVPEKFKLIRLGRSRAEFTRPIKMICESKDSAFNLLFAYTSAKRSGKPFPEGFRMSRDRTSLQRKLLRSCYEELQRRVKSGETGLRVIFVNGGGGVLIGIHKDYPASIIYVPDLNVEHVFVRFTVGQSSFALGGVYFPPKSFPILYESHINSIDYISKNYPAHAFILCGDYNFLGISWDNDDHGLIYSSSSHSLGTCISEAFATCGFYLKNNIANRFDSILDLVFSTDLYHPALNIYLPINLYSLHHNRSHSFYNFRRKANFEDARLFLSSFDWYSTFQLYNVDAAFNSFYDALHKSVLDIVPKCTFTDSKFPPWFDKSLKNILFLKKKAHIKFKTSSNAHDYREFSLLRARFKYESKRCLHRYFERIESSLNSNPADYWKFVKSKRSFSAIPKEVSYRETTSTNEREVANSFSQYFSSVFSDNQLNLDTSSLGIKSFDLPNNVNFTVENVYKHLTDLRGFSPLSNLLIISDLLLFHVLTTM
ncbi:hypothetical protein ACI65C_004285 [Semiaphis heraclei]